MDNLTPKEISEAIWAESKKETESLTNDFDELYGAEMIEQAIIEAKIEQVEEIWDCYNVIQGIDFRTRMGQIRAKLREQLKTKAK